MKYYYSKDGSDVQGPCSLDDISRRYFAGDLPATTQVCDERTQTWQSLVSLLQSRHMTASQPGTKKESSSVQLARSAARCVVAIWDGLNRDRSFTPLDRTEIGWGVIAIGALLAGYFFFIYDTSVHVGTTAVPRYGAVGVERVNNMGLMQNRLLGCSAGMLTVLIGTIILVTNPKKPSE